MRVDVYVEKAEDAENVHVHQKLQSRFYVNHRSSKHVPKLLLVLYLCAAILVSAFCINYLAKRKSAPQGNNFFIELFGISADSTCPDGANFCRNTSWIPASRLDSGDASESDSDSVSSNEVTIIAVSVVISVWFGPLVSYVLFLGCLRCIHAKEFERLRSSHEYESWVIISGCFRMTIDSSSGDNNFNETAQSLANMHAGCGEECCWHFIGCWFCGPCYPFCMCCVTANRNQSKVSRLQFRLSVEGYTTEAKYFASMIPSCCNSIFIGMIHRNDDPVMFISSPQNNRNVQFQPIPVHRSAQYATLSNSAEGEGEGVPYEYTTQQEGPELLASAPAPVHPGPILMTS